MIRRPPRSTLFPYNDALPISLGALADDVLRRLEQGDEIHQSRGEPLSHLSGPHHAIGGFRSEEHTSELQSQSNLVCRLLLEKKNPPRSSSLLGVRRHCADPSS